MVRVEKPNRSCSIITANFGYEASEMQSVLSKMVCFSLHLFVFLDGGCF